MIRSLTEEDWARLSGIPVRQSRELARCEYPAPADSSTTERLVEIASHFRENVSLCTLGPAQEGAGEITEQVIGEFPTA